MLQPILTYVRSETILADLLDSGLIELDGSGIPKNEKLMVCWRVKGFGTPDDGCWQQSSLVQASRSGMQKNNLVAFLRCV